jgi:glycosyltransferase involved in cell wall biosynthesis
MKRRFVKDQVAVLLCCKDGERFLAEQLDSLSAQTYSHWKLWVSDDGSQDDTLAIIQRFQAVCGEEKVSIIAGPGKGFAANFCTLTCRPDIEADYYAYADQDDIWYPEKIDRALNWLATIPSSVPALYCGRTCLVDETGRDLGLSPLFARHPSFANALVQSIAGGNTMMFNNAARALLLEAGPHLDVVSHDWWSYILVTGCGGMVFFDPHPTVRYRQHGRNLVGDNRSLPARLARLRMILRGGFRVWNTRNLTALQSMAWRLTSENRRIYEQFSTSRYQPLFSRLIRLRSSGVCRQSVAGDLALFAAAVFKKL